MTVSTSRLQLIHSLTVPFQEDVLELVELSEDIRRDRRQRIREIQWERERLNDRRDRRPWDEERVVEREIIYEGRKPGRYLM